MAQTGSDACGLRRAAVKQFIIRDDAIRLRCAAWIERECPEGWLVKAQPPNRTSEQNAHFHAICWELQQLKAEWAGKARNAAEWKVLLVSGHAVATKDGAEIVPGLEGEFINLRESTALMSKKRGASLIEYSLAFLASVQQ